MSKKLSEYEKAYRKVQRRIENLKKSIGKTKLVSEFELRYANIGGIPTEAEAIRRGIYENVKKDLSMFLDKPTTVTQYKKTRAEKIKIFHEYGYEKVNTKNYEYSLAVLEAFRSLFEYVPSDEVLDNIDDKTQITDIEELFGISPKDFGIQFTDDFGRNKKLEL